jgi:hypothetical protein
MPVIYTLLCATLVYVAILTFFGRRLMYIRWITAAGSLSLAVAFGMLALVTADVFKHGQYALITRMGFAGYGVSLILTIALYWREAWLLRRGR